MPQTTRAIVWMAGACACYAGVYVAVRRLSQDLPLVELVFLRAVLGVLMMCPMLMRDGLAALRTRRLGVYLWRSAASFSGMLAWFNALSSLPLGDATALLFTVPIFTVILAVMFLGEKPGVYRWAAVLSGFAGALIIIRPGFAEISLTAMGVLFTAVCYAGVNIFTKVLTRTDTIAAVVFYQFFLIMFYASIPTAYLWVTPGWAEVPWLLGFGTVSYIAQQCMTRSFASAEATVVMPITFLQLPIVTVLALLLFAELPNPWTWVGAAVIVAATTVIARREAAAGRAH